jgi:hypothetical protein
VMRAAGQRRPVGRFRPLEVVYPRDVLDNAVFGMVPNVHPEVEMCLLVFIGQVRRDLTRAPDFYIHVFAYRLRRRAPSTCARHAPNT